MSHNASNLLLFGTYIPKDTLIKGVWECLAGASTSDHWGRRGQGPRTPGQGRGESRWGHRGRSSGAGCRLGRPLRARQVQVGQGAEYETPLRVLMQPTVAHLAKPEIAFEHPKRVLHSGAVVAPDSVGGPLHAGQHPTPRALDLDARCHVGGHLL